MVNELQNLMYNLSNMMPMLIVVLALGDLAFPEYFAGFEAVTILGAFGVIFAFGIAFWYSRKHLQKSQ